MTPDEKYMRLALRLARKARGKTSPNPMVGAVVVRGKTIVGTGYHHRAGEPHAEVLALRQAGKKAKGGTLYLNLEPCNQRLYRPLHSCRDPSHWSRCEADIR